jgi:hypothetical protein
MGVVCIVPLSCMWFVVSITSGSSSSHGYGCGCDALSREIVVGFMDQCIGSIGIHFGS